MILRQYRDGESEYRDICSRAGISLALLIPQMVSTALHASLPEELLPMPLYLADSVKKYKPAPAIYDGLRKAFSNASRVQGNSPDVWLVSG